MVIFLVALIVLGPQQLPKAMRTMGNIMAEIRKVSSGFQAEMRAAMDTLGDDSPSKPSGGASEGAAPSAPATTTAAIDTTGTAAPTAPTMGQADVTEVVARNPEAPGPVTAEPEPLPRTRPAIDPVDRAAG